MTCPAESCDKVVYCLNGQAQKFANYSSPTGRSCAAECDNNCCVGIEACDGGRFPVCADEGSSKRIVFHLNFSSFRLTVAGM